MDAVALLTTLYAFSGIAACAFYGPQVWRLVRHAEARRALALSSWGGWLAASVVAVLYGSFVTGEAAMIVVSGLNAACQAVVVVLVAGQRLADSKKGRRLGEPALLGGRNQTQARAMRLRTLFSVLRNSG